jgi:hypothetical protein
MRLQLGLQTSLKSTLSQDNYRRREVESNFVSDAESNSWKSV